ncbi:MAG: ABC transporter ATP-binding protein [Sedimentisphaerales bacterium]|nr:ABC transporter ATP-binding protein [Sedimentisphaerales bacterium]
MDHVVSIKGLSKRFGRIQALNGVSFDVPAKSIFGLLGPNGAGKTTLFSIIADFLKADAGLVEVLGINTLNISRLQGRLSILPQDARFQRNVPIMEQLVFFRLLAGSTRKQAEEEVIHSFELVGLKSVAKRRVGSLSHGMVKRLGIAQAFLGHPEVILLDEPTAGLDPANARQIRDLIKQLQERATIVVSSHNLDEVQELCDHVAILNRGNLVLTGSVDEITCADREYYISLSRPLQDSELEELSLIEGVRSIKSQPATVAGQGKCSAEYLLTLDLSGKNAEQDGVIAAILRTVLQMDITPRKLTEGRSLETQFLEVTGGQTEV